MAKVSFDVKEKSLKNIRKKFQENGVFYSSSELALKLKSLLPNNGEDATEIYDPTCGGGSLLSVFPDCVKKYGQELDENQAEYCCETLKNAEIVAGDTLESPAFLDKKFKYIIANPPFSVKWKQNKDDERFKVAPALAPANKADFAFILHCLHYLSDDGTAVILGSHGPLFRSGAEGKIRQWLIEQNYIDKIVSFGPGYFEDTNVATVAMVLKKHRDTTDVTFEDTVVGKGRVVKLDEIINHSFSLAINLYIKAEEDSFNFVDSMVQMAEFRDGLSEMIVVALECEKMLENGCHPAVFNLKKLKQQLHAAIDSVE